MILKNLLFVLLFASTPIITANTPLNTKEWKQTAKTLINDLENIWGETLCLKALGYRSITHYGYRYETMLRAIEFVHTPCPTDDQDDDLAYLKKVLQLQYELQAKKLKLDLALPKETLLLIIEFKTLRSLIKNHFNIVRSAPWLAWWNKYPTKNDILNVVTRAEMLLTKPYGNGCLPFLEKKLDTFQGIFWAYKKQFLH